VPEVGDLSAEILGHLTDLGLAQSGDAQGLGQLLHPPVLRDLAGQIDRGLIYDRELLAVARAVDEVLASFRRRPNRR
jgi:hypothetical protein